MIIQKGYKTELDLNNVQRTLCLKHTGAARFAYNWGLAVIKEKLKERKAAADPKSVKIPSAMDLKNALNSLKAEHYPWMYEVSKCAPEEALRNLGDAFDNFFAKRTRFPRFKKKRDGVGTCTLYGHIHVGEDWIQLPRLGTLRLYEHNYIPRDDDERPECKAIIVSATLSSQAGHWFVSVLVEEEIPDPEAATGESIGIDLGIKELAVTSEDVRIPNPKALKGRLKAMKRSQKHLSRCKKGGENRQKAKKAIAILHYKVACLREDKLQKATTQLVAKTKPKEERPEAIIMEQLRVKNMMHNHKLAQAIADVGMGKFGQYMRYKSTYAGIALKEADPFFPSTQLCSGCHRLPSHKIGLEVRTYVCEYCHLTIDRDLNAARNLQWLNTVGLTEIEACRESVSPEVLSHFRLFSVTRELSSR